MLGAITIVPSVARAETLESREREAKETCLAGEYAKGVSLLGELFVETKDITYLYNQGRCYELSGRYHDAILRFREYLRKNHNAGRAPDRVAEAHLADCEARSKQVAAQQDAKAVRPPRARRTEPIARASRGEASQPSSDGLGLRTAGIVGLGVGVVALGTGVLFNVKANHLANELESTRNDYQRSKESSRKSYQTFGWISYGAGAVCLAGGATLYVLGLARGNESRVAVLPALGPGMAGATLQGAF